MADFFFYRGCRVDWSSLILWVLVDLRANISSSFLSFFCKDLLRVPDVPSSFISFTLSAYLREFKVCSVQELAGLTFAIIVVLLLPVKESFKTLVS
jgi:hypothetical protein